MLRSAVSYLVLLACSVRIAASQRPYHVERTKDRFTGVEAVSAQLPLAPDIDPSECRLMNLSVFRTRNKDSTITAIGLGIGYTPEGWLGPAQRAQFIIDTLHLSIDPIDVTKAAPLPSGGAMFVFTTSTEFLRRMAKADSVFGRLSADDGRCDFRVSRAAQKVLSQFVVDYAPKE